MPLFFLPEALDGDDLARLMIVVSDNAATDVVLDRLGTAAVNRALTELGCTGTDVKHDVRGLFQTIVEDALRGGRGTRLEMTVVSRVGVAGLEQLRNQFSWLADRGINVTVRHGRGPSPLGEPAAHP